MKIKDIQGKRVSIIGAARSGIAVAKLLHTYGAIVFVSDIGTSDTIKTNIKQLQSLGIDGEFGIHSDRVYNADLFVLSPGVPTKSPVIEGAQKRNLKIISEIEVASWFCPAPIIAITGTNGKTTTTTLTYRMFEDANRKVAIGGNIDPAFSTIIPKLDSSSIAVLEISSFQLDFIETFHPKISVILNITPDHLDRYDGSFELYAKAKCRIFKNQGVGDYLIYCDDDVTTREIVSKYTKKNITLLPFTINHRNDIGAFIRDKKLITQVEGKEMEVIDLEQVGIKGMHNLYNAMAAVLCAQIQGIDISSIRTTLKNFKGVEHRLEFVRELNGVKYINDSKATNVDSVWYAMQAYSDPIVLLLGGRDKGNDYSKLVDLVKNKVRAIIALGESADKIVNNFNSIVKVVKVSNMESAVKQAKQLAQNGDIVLLSPACASFDWFTDYEHRGREFKKNVNLLSGEFL